MTIEFFQETHPGTRTFPRSIATRAGGLVFVSGQVARDENVDVVTGGIEAHTRQAGTKIEIEVIAYRP
jgi:enamine deaminase RidA (YjgF/YER057c/UK114 family)